MAPPEGIRHLLVRLPNPLGDAVLATPALRALRAALPETRITWAGGPAALAALDGLPFRDGIMPVAGAFARGTRGPFRVGRMWRRAGVDAVLLLPNSLSSALAARWSGARIRVGSPLGGRALLLTHPVDLPLEDGRLAPRPMTSIYLDLAAALGAAPQGTRPEVAVTPFDRERADRRLADVEGSLLVVNPGAAFGSSKICPPERLGRILGAVRKRVGTEVLVVCGPGEEDLARAVAEEAGGGARSTADDPPDLGELKGLLDRADAVLTTDAGPRHLAEALGTPTVVLMGPTDPRWSAGGQARVVRAEDLPCLACHHPVCPIEHPCMREMPIEAAASAVADALTGGSPG